MKLVNIKTDDFDVYIGRGNCPKTGRPSIWGNPFTHHSKTTLAEVIVESREEALEKYREYILNKPELLDRLDELKGKRLGCWCLEEHPFPIPYVCHGQILIELLTKKNLKKLLEKFGSSK